MSYGLTIDPGLSTGVCLFWYSDDESIRIEKVWQFPGGAENIHRFLTSYNVIDIHGRLYMNWAGGLIMLSALVVEKFTPGQGSRNDSFHATQDNSEPLRGEGVVIGHGFGEFIQWGQPAQQYFMGGDDLVQKKKRSREFLKLHGMYPTGKTVGQKDADDAISATLHSIAWLRRQRHMPTMLALFGPREDA